MKTLTVYALVLGTGVMTLLSLLEQKESQHIPTGTFEQSSTFEQYSVAEMPAIHSDSNNNSEFRKKEYHIYFENKSDESLDVAIRYKDYHGDWNTQGFVTLKAGEKKHMGVSDQKTYFYYAENQHKWKKRKWAGNYSFPINESDLNKIRFVKQEIWECYDTEMCNTFAVFR